MNPVKSKKRVLLFIESLTYYGRGILKGIVQYTKLKDDWHITMDERGLLDPPPRWLGNWQGDGIISRTANPLALRILGKKPEHFVELLGNNKDRPAEVVEDEELTCQMAFDHFRELGFKHFAFYAFGNCWWIDCRVKTYYRILKKHGIFCHSFVEKMSGSANLHPVWDEHYEPALIDWLRQLPKPVALMTVYDFQSAIVIEACHKTGLRVPEEIAILGTNNDEHLCNLFNPTISSIDSNPARIGYEAAKLLDLKMQQQKIAPGPILISPIGIVRRRSTDILMLDDEDVATAIAFINDNVYSGITVADIVQAVCISQSTLLRRFKQILGRTPAQEITRLRMSRAKELLTTTNLSVTAIAESCGFADSAYFVKAFVRSIGRTPLQFRRQEQIFIEPQQSE